MTILAVTLHRAGFDHARSLVAEGEIVFDDHDAWSEHQPSAEQENEFIREHGHAEYRRWHLEIDGAEREGTKAHDTFPFGDCRNVRRCAVLSAAGRAGQYEYRDLENAAAHLHGTIDAHAAHAR